jgi:hypothetical protein
MINPIDNSHNRVVPLPTPVIEAEPVPNLNPLAAFLSVEDISTPNRFDLANLF